MSDPATPATVLVVDDEDQVRDLVQEVLETHGYTVLVARDGEDALRVAQQHGGAIHLLVTDMVMPRMSGARLFERLSLARPGLRALYVSGYADQTTAAAHGFQAPLLLKPFTPNVLLARVGEALTVPGGV
jgi:two-component system, cell cycle sensor histidine kinase and response regulator CckA